MASHNEVEIKFRVLNPSALNRALRNAGFRLVTASAHEMNTLYDLPGQALRKRGDLLRLRKYGQDWVLTHKAKGKVGRHKSRVENETAVSDGPRTDKILRALGFVPVFCYEKLRAEWSDGRGHVVVDKTPIGNFAEIEGPPRWIDRTARALRVRSSDYITETYAGLFLAWKKQTGNAAKDMTFRALRQRTKQAPNY